MKKLKVLVHMVTITQEAEKQYFQIPLPANAKRIVGIELGYKQKQP